MRRAAVIGTGTMGPGMGAVLARAGIETALYDVSAEALERSKAGAELAGGILERLDAAQEDGGSLRFETDFAAALRCNVNFGDPHIEAYCIVLKDGRLYSDHQDPAIPSRRDSRAPPATIVTS